LTSLVKRALWASACFLVAAVADAEDLPAGIKALTGASPQVEAPPVARPAPLSQDEFSALTRAIDAARSGDLEQARSLQQAMSDPVARKLVLWTMVDADGDRLSFFELDQARRDLWGWPRAGKRQAAAEKLLESSGLTPQQTVDWFKGEAPQTAQGAMALASAERSLGRAEEARKLIRRFWREQVFDADAQAQMQTRFADDLTPEDNLARADMLLYGQQGPAAQAMVALLPPEQQAAARARLALRAEAADANALVNALPPSLQTSPGMAYERSRYLRAHGLDVIALGLGRYLDPTPTAETEDPLWRERRYLITAALKAHDYKAGYEVAAHNGLPPGVDAAEAEFYAGWLALTKLRDPRRADTHFARVEQAGSSPLTRSRALYWRGRAAEAMGDGARAKDLYGRAAQFTTAFYGLLAAEKAGEGEFALPKDPVPSAADRARFEGRELIRASRLLAQAGEKQLFRIFVMTVDDTLPNAEEYVLLSDLAKGYGDQDLSMKVARAGAQHGFVLLDRGYPMPASLLPDAGPEKAFVFSLIRQESNFDPDMRSGAGARGMMQLMPGTAQGLARSLGVSYSPERLDDPAYNVRLGTAYLDNILDRFDGSYVMAAAAYNAGPGRLPQWTAYCGDPRGGQVDPIDFIECIPFSETRNYVMRLMETMEVYRAKMNGGHAALTLSQDLRRGGGPGNPSSAAPASSAGAGN
jgi:soluble lytic murein transglycosylase